MKRRRPETGGFPYDHLPTHDIPAPQAAPSWRQTQMERRSPFALNTRPVVQGGSYEYVGRHRSHRHKG